MPPPRVLLLDDGELGDVASLLSELGVDFERCRGGQIGDDLEPPRDLLITTPRRAAAVQRSPDDGTSSQRPVRIIAVGEDSCAMRRRMRDMGFHLLVRRPVHRPVWSLLVRRALYRGVERRSEDRMPGGVEVLLADGAGHRSTALLLDLSERGCRVLARQALVSVGSVSIEIPASATGGRPLNLDAEVARIEEDTDASDVRSWLAALRFRLAPDEHARRELGVLLDRWAQAPPSIAITDEPMATPGDDPYPHRRAHLRGPFGGAVRAITDSGGRVAMGRDLSAGGMRLEPTAELQVGDHLEIAMYGPTRTEAVRVQAQVIRDDGPLGIALRFENVPEHIAGELEKMVACLPDVESLEDAEADRLGTVVSEILPGH